jgi:hypothetical protein
MSAYEEIGNVDKYAWFSHEFESIYAHSSKSRINACRGYIQSIIKDPKRLSVVNVSYQGSVSQFLKEQCSLDSTEYVLAEIADDYGELEGNTSKAFIEYGRGTTIRTKSFLQEFLKLVLCEQTPNITGFTENEKGVIEPVIDSPLDPIPDDRVSQIQEGILEYTQLFSKLLGPYLSNLEYHRYLFWDIIETLLADPAKKDAELLWDIGVSTRLPSDHSKTFEKWYQSSFSSKSGK